jgi:hypothetical protein
MKKKTDQFKSNITHEIDLDSGKPELEEKDIR